MSYMVAVERRREARSSHTLPSALGEFDRTLVRLQETHHKETDIKRDHESVVGSGTQGQQEKAAKYAIQTVTSLDQVQNRTVVSHLSGIYVWRCPRRNGMHV